MSYNFLQGILAHFRYLEVGLDSLVTCSFHFSGLGWCLLVGRLLYLLVILHVFLFHQLELVVLQGFLLLSLDRLNQTAVEQCTALLLFSH